MIKAEGLKFSYGSNQVLQGADLTLEGGTFCALVGANGCGKSTLVRLLAGLEEPSGGRLFVDGTPRQELSRRQYARRVALLPQSRSVPAITARELVSHGRFPWLDGTRRLSGRDREIVSLSLCRAGAADLAHRDMQSLSGGQRQKVYLAMLLAQDTPNILLDEPTTFLDISARFSLMEDLKAAAGEGKAVLAVLHDLSLAMKFCHRIAIMDGGTIKISATPEKVAESGFFESVFGVSCRRSEGEYLFSKI